MKKKIAVIASIILFLSTFAAAGCNKGYDKPKIYFNSFVEDIKTKDDERYTTIRYVDEYGKETTYPVRVKIQGDSSLNFAKKNFNLTFYTDSTYSKKEKIVTRYGEESKWTLKANWIDKTHARNIVTARLAADLNEKYGVFDNTINHGVIDGYPVEVYMNDEFYGLYTWNIGKGKWIWGVDDNIPGQVVIGANAWTDGTAMWEEINDFDEESGWEVEEGIYDAETVSNFNNMVNFINNSSDEDFKNHFFDYMDKDATINYLLMIYIANLIDNTNKNMFLVTYDNGKTWYPALYDLDVSWGTYWDSSKIKYDFNPINETDEDTVHSQMVNKLWKRLMDNFGEEISDRYFSLRNDLFSYDSIINRFREFKNAIGDEGYEKDRERWGNMPGYDIEQIEEYLQFKLPWLDEYMERIGE